MKSEFEVTGMTCSACSSHVDKAVRKIDGVQEVNVNLLTNHMSVKYDETRTGENAIIKAVQESGYGANPLGKVVKKQTKAEPNKQDNQKEIKYRLIVSFLFLIPLMYIAMGHMFHFPMPEIFHGTKNAVTFSFTQFLLTIPILYVNRSYYQRGFKALIKKAPNMDSLIAIGSLSAFIYGIYAIYRIGYGLGHGQIEVVEHFTMSLYFESAGMILALITLGKYLEARAKGKTTQAINKLIDLSPKTAIVIKDGKEERVSTEELRVGDRILVKPGESVPVDGVLDKGMSYIDESAITGESVPIKKQYGDKVISATINQSGSFEMIAQKVGQDTTLSQIIQLVEEASSSKAPISKMADKISGIFVPTVIGISLIALIIWLLLGYSFEFALSIAISILVISCPCALGLATPVSIMVGTGKGAESGILIKSAESLEIAHLVDCIVLDKTGTVTEGKPKVTDLYETEGHTAKEILEVMASLEGRSEHPIAQAIIQKAKQEEMVTKEIEEFKAISGKGIQGKLDGKLYFAGNQNFMKENQINIAKEQSKFLSLASEGKTPIYVASETELLGILGIRDEIKDSSKQAIEDFKKMNLEVVLLTGDHSDVAQVIGNELGITHIISEVLPQDKEKQIRILQEQGKKVAMIGDGINDSPAITRADVGIAIGAGTDIAIESADIVLMKSNLQDAVTAIDLSKEVIKNIKMNLFWAFFYNSIGIPVAAGVLYPAFGLLLNPMIAAAAMSLSSICVVTNALRLRKFKPQKWEQERRKKKMQKIIKIQGMQCNHCKMAVEKALNAIEQVESVQVDLEQGKATVNLKEAVTEDCLRQAIDQAGYQVTEIQ